MKIFFLLVFLTPLFLFGNTSNTRYWDQLFNSGDKKQLEAILTKVLEKEHFKKLNREEKITALSILSSVRLEQGKYYQSLELLTKARTFNTHGSEALSYIYDIRYANLFKEIGANGLSISYFTKCYKRSKTVFEKYYLISSVGSAYLLKNDYQNAEKCFRKQVDFANQLKNKLQIASAQNNLGYTFYKAGNLRDAKNCYQKSLSALGQSYTPGQLGHPKDDFTYSLFENLGATCYELGEYQLAVEYLSLAFERKKSFSLTDPNCDIYGEMCLVISLLRLGKQHEAEAIVQQFEEHSSKMKNLRKMEFLDMKIELCLFKKQTDKASKLLYERGIVEQKYMDHKRAKLSATSDLVAQFMLDNYTQVLKHEKIQRQAEARKNKFISILWLISSLLLIVLLIFVRQVARNRQKKYKLEQELKAIEEERLQLKLKVQENSLTDLALEVIEKQKVSNDLVEKMNTLVHEDDEKIKKELVNTLRLLKTQQNNQLKSEYDDPETILQLKDFHQRLRKICGSISKSEMELSTFIRLDFSNKKIASVKNCTENTIKTAKNRLKKKLGLNLTDSLTKFIQDI